MHENFAERSRPIVLIGPMAAGKTYIGTHLARFTAMNFSTPTSSSLNATAKSPKSSRIFGEAHFRELERKTIEEVLTSPCTATRCFPWAVARP